MIREMGGTKKKQANKQSHRHVRQHLLSLRPLTRSENYKLQPNTKTFKLKYKAKSG